LSWPFLYLAYKLRKIGETRQAVIFRSQQTSQPVINKPIFYTKVGLISALLVLSCGLLIMSLFIDEKLEEFIL